MGDRSPTVARVMAATAIDAAPLGAYAAFWAWWLWGPRLKAEELGLVPRETASPATVAGSRRWLGRRMLVGELAHGLLMAGAIVGLGGRTPGRALLGLRVVSTHEAPVSLPRAVVLTLAHELPVGIVLRRSPRTAISALDWSVAIAHPQRRSIRHLLARTRDVMSR